MSDEGDCPVTENGSGSTRFDSRPLLPELRLAIGLVTAACTIAALYFCRAILVPLALAVFLGFVLDPLVVRLKRLGLPRTPAVAVAVAVAVVMVTLATLALIALGGLFLANQVATPSARLPTYQSNIADKLKGLCTRGRHGSTGRACSTASLKPSRPSGARSASLPRRPRRLPAQALLACCRRAAR